VFTSGGGFAEPRVGEICLWQRITPAPQNYAGTDEKWRQTAIARKKFPSRVMQRALAPPGFFAKLNEQILSWQLSKS
jgi:hypothetical protein